MRLRRYGARMEALEHAEHGAEPQAHRPLLAAPAWRIRARRRCRDEPRRRLRARSAEEQGRGDAAGHRRIGRIGEVGEVALEHFVVGAPQRHSPHWVVGSRARSRVGGKRVVIGEKAGRSGPSATRAAPVSVAKSTISSGSSSAARVSASASTSRPSARYCRFRRTGPCASERCRRADKRRRYRIFDRRDQQMKADRKPRRR